MKKALITTILAVILKASSGQVSCSYAGGSCSSNLRYATSYTEYWVGQICQVLRVSSIPVFQADVPNACAILYNGQSIITYNPQFMNWLYNQNEWGPISVLAHEVGHHINRDIGWYGQFKHPWTKELLADFISGYVLYHLGASLYDANSAFQLMFSWLGTESHPDTPKRIDALTKGWYMASYGY